MSLYKYIFGKILHYISSFSLVFLTEYVHNFSSHTHFILVLFSCVCPNLILDIIISSLLFSFSHFPSFLCML